MTPSDPLIPAPAPPVRTRLVRGSLWMVAMRFSIRGIGLVSTIILARLLTPADFGIVAMAMLMIGFVEVFNETGQQAALIANPNPTRAHYDSAWTVTVLIAAALTAIVLIFAPYAPLYFRDDRIVPVIQLLSLRILLGGFLNIGTIDFRRNLDFAREFRFMLGRKAATFVTTLTLALLWRDYWALVVGVVVGHVMEVALSYIMHHYRPRFSFAKVREIWGYSAWILVQSIGRFFETRIDEVAVAGVAPPADMGRYAVAAEFGALPMTEIVEPVSRALFPNYARIAADPVLLRDVYLRVFSAAVAVCACLGTGLALVAHDFVAVVLGAQWAAAAPLLMWFAAAGAVSGISNTVYAVFNARGQSRHSAKQTWLRVLVYAPAVWWAASTGVLLNFAIVRLVVGLVLMPTFFLRLKSVIPITLLQLVAAAWRPLAAAAIMAGTIILADFSEQLSSPLFRLICTVALGGGVFVAAQVGLWKLAGGRPGLEKDLLALCRMRFRRAA